MDFEKFNKFGSLLLKDEFVLSYSGYASEDVLHSMGETLRQRLGDHTDDKGKIKHVFWMLMRWNGFKHQWRVPVPFRAPSTPIRSAIPPTLRLRMILRNNTSLFATA